ncbi:hypothetical protein B0H14DRAFT_2343924, partial [Mycena olivaceomarginata]
RDSRQRVRIGERNSCANIHISFSFVCTNSGFAGTCSVFRGASGECISFPGDFNDDITSIGPDSGQDCFFLRNDLGCTGQQLGPIRSPGISNLASNAGFNDQISSFQ